MLLFILAFVGGVFTILSPRILPVLPFVFTRADQPFRKSGLPLLVGMALTFAIIATLTVTGGTWLVRTNQYGRILALCVFSFVGLTLLLPSFAEIVTRPFVRLGNRLTSKADAQPRSQLLQALLLGVATGLLWAPCAGPILGLIVAGAAVSGPSIRTSFLLLAYALGAATSLSVALFAGGRVFAAMKRSLGAEEWIRRGLGVMVLLGVVAIAFGLDRGILTRVAPPSTSGVEQGLVDRVQPQRTTPLITETVTADAEPSVLPDLSGSTARLNSPPLTREGLKGKVVLIDFWTYSCITCLRTSPYVEAWSQKYKDSGLVVIGVHTPEFPFEKDKGNVEKAIHDLGITYPVAMDNTYAIWNAFNNEYWPAHYFIDANGKIRFHHFGEGRYDESERWMQELLKERNGHPTLPTGIVTVSGQGAEAASDTDEVQSPETYIGYSRAEHFASPGGFKPDTPADYTLPSSYDLNQWALSGDWVDHEQIAQSLTTGAKISFRFRARDLHLVLGPGEDGKPIHFRVTLDGKPPGNSHGADTNTDGNGMVTEYRLYQLVRQREVIKNHTFQIEFSEPGVQAFAFTFG
jgi:cytochrome c biogenesis protein CcdA/thiol-disulfide isomerase/thioredoxin